MHVYKRIALEVKNNVFLIGLGQLALPIKLSEIFSIPRPHTLRARFDRKLTRYTLRAELHKSYVMGIYQIYYSYVSYIFGVTQPIPAFKWQFNAIYLTNDIVIRVNVRYIDNDIRYHWRVYVILLFSLMKCLTVREVCYNRQVHLNSHYKSDNFYHNEMKYSGSINKRFYMSKSTVLLTFENVFFYSFMHLRIVP